MRWFKKGPKKEVLWYPLDKKGELSVVVNWLLTVLLKTSQGMTLTLVSWSIHYPPREEVEKSIRNREGAPAAVMRIVLYWNPEIVYRFWLPRRLFRKTIRPCDRFTWAEYWGLVRTRWLSRIIERQHKVSVRYTLTTPIVRKEENEESLEEK